MTLRERILAVYRGETPDVVPCMLDLSHWYYATNRLPWDLSAPFVQPTQGPVIGKAAIHHGVFQDMTASAVKRQFLQLYVNWRHRDRTGAPGKIWCWGWAGHAHDFDPGEARAVS